MNSPEVNGLHVALIGSRPAAHGGLRDVLLDNGFVVDHDLHLDELTLRHIYDIDVDAVLVDLDESADQKLELLEAILEHSPAPVLFNDAAYSETRSELGDRHLRTLMTKLRKISPRKGSAELTQTRQPPMPAAEQGVEVPSAETRKSTATGGSAAIPPVLILGASLGGPAALREFFASLPKSPPVCFIVAQHIGDTHVDLFSSQLNRIGTVPVSMVGPDSRLKPGAALVAPVEQQLLFHKDGSADLVPWDRRPRYAPSIDRIIEAAVDAYGKQVSVIIFSGMGNDGEHGSLFAAHKGCRVWAQDSDSCVISSMPDRARSTGAVSFSGTPAQLAARVAEMYQGVHRELPASG